MKTLIFSAFFISIGINAYCQKVELPLKDSLIVYEKTIQLDSTYKKEMLYKSAKIWFINNLNSKDSVIKYEDFTSGKIIGKLEIHIPVSLYIMGYLGKNCTFSVQIEVKDGKYKYKISDFIMLITYPHSTLKIDASNRYLKYLNEDYKAVGFVGKKRLMNDFNESFANFDNQIKRLTESLNKALKSSKSESF